MGIFREYPSNQTNDFVEHELKTYQRKGDLVRSEYERLNPDGTVTKSLAYGNVKEGLNYRTFHMGVDGSVREIAPEQPSSPRAVSNQQYHAQPAPQRPAPQPQVAQPKAEAPRKTYAFIVEPKPEGGWKIKYMNLEKANDQTHQSHPQVQQSAPPPAQPKKSCPWWYETFKDVLEEKPLEKPPVESLEKKVSKRLFDWFDDDLFLMKPPKTSYRRPKDSFDLLAESLFDRPLLSDMFSGSLLSDF